MSLKIFSLELENFRQFKSVKKIEFSVDDEKRFTIIQGSNGSGKTNLLNAITWCLYGQEKHLSKISRGQTAQAINNKALEECASNNYIKMKVRLRLGDEKPDYIIQREKRWYKYSDGHITSDDKDDFRVLWLSGGRDWKPVTSQPNYFINLLLPEGIHDFFFFDGEKLDDFFKSGSNDRIQDSIISVAQISLLDKAMEHLDYLQDHLRRSAKGLGSNAEEKSAKIDSIKGEIGKNREQLTQLKFQDATVESKILQIDARLKLSSVADIKLLQREREQLDKDIEILQSRKANVKLESNHHLVDSAPYVYARQAILVTFKLINESYRKGDLPPKIREPYLREILDSGRCICGTPLSNGSPERQKVERLLKVAQFSKIDQAVASGKFKMDEILKDMNQFLTIRNSHGRKLESFEKEIQEKQERLKEISNQLIKSEEEEVQKLESDRRNLQEERNALHQKIGAVDYYIRDAQSKLDTETSEYEKELAKSKKYSQLKNQFVFCEKSLEVLKKIKDEVVNEVQKTIESRTKQYFLGLIWKKETFVDVKIDANYNISVIHKGNWDALSVLSAGERQVLALSFMAALREAARVNAPVVIDTPLGRISGEPKENIAHLLPEYLRNTQVILFVTDQEYTQPVRSLLLPRIGKEYRLDYNEKVQETLIV